MLPSPGHPAPPWFLLGSVVQATLSPFLQHSGGLPGRGQEAALIFALWFCDLW